VSFQLSGASPENWSSQKWSFLEDTEERKGDGPIFLKNRTVPFFMTFIAEKPPLFFKERLSSSPT
jgi:hypothetical protein